MLGLRLQARTAPVISHCPEPACHWRAARRVGIIVVIAHHGAGRPPCSAGAVGAAGMMTATTAALISSASQMASRSCRIAAGMSPAPTRRATMAP